ncbi:MAG: hypothetical protein KAR07_06380, partial [Spirochaetes bacterium]|nr:hypothetical protein [Spirochaetota bacterium]
MKIVVTLSFILCTLLVENSISQTLLDDFNRTDNTTVGNGWSETETAASGAEINGDHLQMNTNSSVGREWVYQDVNTEYETIFDDNTSNLVWYCNVRQSYT